MKTIKLGHGTDPRNSITFNADSAARKPRESFVEAGLAAGHWASLSEPQRRAMLERAHALSCEAVHGVATVTAMLDTAPEASTEPVTTDEPQTPPQTPEQHDEDDSRDEQAAEENRPAKGSRRGRSRDKG